MFNQATGQKVWIALRPDSVEIQTEMVMPHTLSDIEKIKSRFCSIFPGASDVTIPEFNEKLVIATGAIVETANEAQNNFVG